MLTLADIFKYALWVAAIDSVTILRVATAGADFHIGRLLHQNPELVRGLRRVARPDRPATARMIHERSYLRQDCPSRHTTESDTGRMCGTRLHTHQRSRPQPTCQPTPLHPQSDPTQTSPTNRCRTPSKSRLGRQDLRESIRFHRQISPHHPRPISQMSCPPSNHAHHKATPCMCRPDTIQ